MNRTLNCTDQRTQANEDENVLLPTQEKDSEDWDDDGISNNHCEGSNVRQGSLLGNGNKGGGNNKGD
jgi:hypothetical protein